MKMQRSEKVKFKGNDNRRGLLNMLKIERLLQIMVDRAILVTSIW